MQAIDLTDDGTQAMMAAETLVDSETEDEGNTSDVGGDEADAATDTDTAVRAHAVEAAPSTVVAYEEYAARKREEEEELNISASFADAPHRRPYPPSVFAEIDQTMRSRPAGEAFEPGAVNDKARRAELHALRVAELKALGDAHDVSLAGLVEKGEIEVTLFDRGIGPGSEASAGLRRVVNNLGECVSALQALEGESGTEDGRLTANLALCKGFWTSEQYLSKVRDAMVCTDAEIATLVSLERDVVSAERAVAMARSLAPRVPSEVFEALVASLASLAEEDVAQREALVATRAELTQYESAGEAFAVKEAELQQWHAMRHEAILEALVKVARTLPAALGRLVDSLTSRKGAIVDEQRNRLTKHEALKAKVRDGLHSGSDARHLAELSTEIDENRQLLNQLDAEAADTLATLTKTLDERALALLAASSAAAELHIAFSAERFEALPAFAGFVAERVLTALPAPPSPREREPMNPPPHKRARRSFFSSFFSRAPGVEVV